MIAIQMVLPALVKRDHAATHRRFAIANAVAGELGLHHVLRVFVGLTNETLGCRVDVVADIANLFEPAQFHRRTLQLFLAFAHQQAIDQIILFCARDLL